MQRQARASTMANITWMDVDSRQSKTLKVEGKYDSNMQFT